MQIIKPEWPAAENIVAFSTTRLGGFSTRPYDSLNLGMHVKDSPEHVKKNRDLLRTTMDLPREPAWLQQTHSTIAVEVNEQFSYCAADAGYSRDKNQIAVVMTADCLPLLVCNKLGTEVAAIHAGWRGLADGVIEATIAKLASKPEDLLVWLGPAIGPLAFEVGLDVYEKFLQNPEAKLAFQLFKTDKWLMDIYMLARQRLNKLGIKSIYGGSYCTYTDEQRFFSYRRDGDTGRMASLIYIV